MTKLRETITLERAHEHWAELLNLDAGLYHVRFNPVRWSSDFLGHITNVNIWSDRQRAERQLGANWEFRPVFTVLAWKDMDVERLPTFRAGARKSFPFINEVDKFYVTGGAEFDPVGLDFLPVVLGWRWYDTAVDRMLKTGRLPKELKRKEVTHASRT